MDYDQILQTLVQCSERVRQAVVAVERATMSEIVGLGADGADTSRIDQVAENAALAYFESSASSANVLSEEIGFVDRGSPLTFIVDPIDSTSNATVSAPLQVGVPEPEETGAGTFELPHSSGMVGFPYFAFSVGALVEGRLVAACIRNLPTGDVFTAIAGAGARFNNIPIQAPPVTGLSEAWVALIRPAGDEGLRRTREILFGAKRIRVTGCSALDLALIASGSLHALVNPNVHRPPHSGEKVVDYAGAQLILDEAGAILSDTEGNPLPIDHDLARLTPILAAATPELHQTLIRAIHPTEQ